MKNHKKALTAAIAAATLFTSAAAAEMMPRYDLFNTFSPDEFEKIVYYNSGDVILGIELANGETVELDIGSNYVFVDEYMYIPLRLCAETAQYSVAWDDDTSGITLSDDNNTVKLQIDGQTIDKNGETIELISPVLLIDDVTYVRYWDLDTILTR